MIELTHPRAECVGADFLSGQSDGTEQTTLVPGPGVAPRPLPLGRTVSRGVTQPKSVVLRRLPISGSASRPRVRRAVGQMRLLALVEQRRVPAGALSGERDVRVSLIEIHRGDKEISERRRTRRSSVQVARILSSLTEF